jgi:hypothetical protein
VRVRAGTVREREWRALWVIVRPGLVYTGGLRALRMRVRAGRAQQTGGRALQTSKTGRGGGFRVRVTVWTVSKERRGDSTGKGEG